MEGSLGKSEHSDKAHFASHHISISPLTGDKVWRQITRTDALPGPDYRPSPAEYESKRCTVFSRSCVCMTQCNLEGPWVYTLLCVKWGCHHQPLTAWIHSRKLSIKLTLLYAKNNSQSCSIAQWLLYPLASGLVIWCPTHLSTSFLSSPVRLRSKLLFLKATLPGLPGHRLFS